MAGVLWVAKLWDKVHVEVRGYGRIDPVEASAGTPWTGAERWQKPMTSPALHVDWAAKSAVVP